MFLGRMVPMMSKDNWRAEFSMRRLFTLWSTRGWSAALGVFMFFVAGCDVVFTLSDVRRYGLAGEVNPATSLLIGAGGVYVILWVAIDFISTMFLYAPLVSLFLMLPVQSREGKASTIISFILAARISVDLFNVTVYAYSFLESSTALLIIGLGLVFVLRYIIRNGDYLGWGSLSSLFQRLGAGLRSKLIVGFFSHFSRSSRPRIKDVLSDPRPPESKGGSHASGQGFRASPFRVKRSKRRIAVIAFLLLMLPVVVFTVLQFLVIANGIGSQSGFGGLLYQVGPSNEGVVFLEGFFVAIVAVGAMVFLLIRLFDAIEGKEVPA
jgi:hypothetical protein